MRFPIRFGSAYRLVSKSALIAPEDSYLDIDGDWVVARMAWAFRAKFPRAAVRRTSLHSRPVLSRGVHGMAGRWLVNGSGDRILSIELDPPQRAWVTGFPVTLRELLVSVDDPDALANALRGPG